MNRATTYKVATQLLLLFLAALVWALLASAVCAQSYNVPFRRAAAGDPETLICDGTVETVTDGSGACADVDETYSSPDGSWIVGTSGTSDPTARLSFSSPTGSNPTGTQTFHVWVQKCDDATCASPSGGGSPTFTIAVRETGGGSDLATSGTNTITSASGEEFTFDWNASVLSDADGSEVEIYLVCTSNGGGPNARTCAFDTIKWEKN